MFNCRSNKPDSVRFTPYNCSVRLGNDFGTWVSPLEEQSTSRSSSAQKQPVGHWPSEAATLRAASDATAKSNRPAQAEEAIEALLFFLLFIVLAAHFIPHSTPCLVVSA